MKNGQKCFKRIGVLLTTFLLIVMCLAVDTTTVSAAKIKLSKTKITLTQGKKYRLKVKGTKKKVKWSSTKKSVATVNKKGVVTAKKKGTAYIKAKVGKKTYKCKVTVKSKKAPEKPAPTPSTAPVVPPSEPTIAPPAPITPTTPPTAPTVTPSKKPVLSATSLNMRKGEYYQLSVQDPKYVPVWTSSNKNVAEVDSKGKVHAINVGTAEIKVDAGNILVCTVTVTMETKPQTEPVLSKGVIKGQRSVKNEAGEPVVIDVPLNTYTYTFSTIPTNVEELKQYNISGDDGRYKVLALYIMSLRTWKPENQTDCEEMIGYLCNRQLSVYEKQRLAEQMKKSKQYLYLGNAFLNGSTPANNYTPSQPYSITLTQDSVVDEDQVYIPANPSIPSPDQYIAFIYCKASDSGKWIDVYKSSKDGNWYMYKWMDLITSIKAPASSNPF